MNPSSGAEQPNAGQAPTPAQLALLQYLGYTVDHTWTQEIAAASIRDVEGDPAWQETFAAWHRDKMRLHPELFTVPQRSFREARWWQARISDDGLYGYSFQQPSLNQTLHILESLDGQEPGWDRESKARRECRFMNALATLSPELCQPGCSYPHDLPAEGVETDPAAAPDPPPPVFTAPSAPKFSAPAYQAISSGEAPLSRDHGRRGLPASGQAATGGASFQHDTASSGRGGRYLWLLLVVVAAGGGGYFYLHSHPAPAVADELTRGTPPPAVAASGSSASRPLPDASPTTAPFVPVSASASRQRAIAKYPGLARSTSELNRRFLAIYRQLEADRSPRLLQTDWPEQLAAEAAGKISHSPASPDPAVASTPPPLANTPAGTAAAPVATPAPVNAMFFTLEASYKEKVNTTRYHQHGGSQMAGVEVEVRNLARSGGQFMLRCVFFKRPPGHSDQREVLSKEERTVDLAAGQTMHDVFISPPVYRGPHAVYEFDGWLMQLLPVGGGKFIRQIGSTSGIEELGRISTF